MTVPLLDLPSAPTVAPDPDQPALEALATLHTTAGGGGARGGDGGGDGGGLGGGDVGHGAEETAVSWGAGRVVHLVVATAAVMVVGRAVETVAGWVAGLGVD